MKVGEVIYRLLFFVNSNKEKDVYYTIAWTMLQNIKEVPRLNINQLADMCYTSTSTISRFIKKLGYESFGDFKEKVELVLGYYKRDISFHPDFGEKSDIDPSSMVKNFYGVINNHLKETCNNLDIRKLDKLLELIYQHKKINFFGMQFSQYMSMEIQAKLLALGKFVTAFVDVKEQLKCAEESDEDSLAIILSIAGRVGKTDLVNKIKESKSKLVVITQNPKVDFLEDADLVILFGNKNTDKEEFLLGGRYALLSIIDLMYYRYVFLYN